MLRKDTGNWSTLAPIHARNSCDEHGTHHHYVSANTNISVFYFDSVRHPSIYSNLSIFSISQVSWVRRKDDGLNLITFGLHTYSSDSRYSLEYQAPNDWQLLIQYANERDEGHYECQISSHPPLVLVVYLTVVGE